MLYSANPFGVLDVQYVEHLEVAKQFFNKHNQPVYDAELTCVTSHGPQVVVVHKVFLGEDMADAMAEMNQVLVIGFYIPHDGNLTTVINHMDGCVTIDNADEMFGVTKVAPDEAAQ